MCEMPTRSLGVEDLAKGGIAITFVCSQDQDTAKKPKKKDINE
jgi:hypothetical protein